MARINGNYGRLRAGYLFPRIAARVREFLEKNPGTRVMRLGIGDTTEPLAPTVAAGMGEAVGRLASPETYTGYGDEQGDAKLREAISARYARLGARVGVGEIFVSDGAKPDAGNIQSIFSRDCKVAVQDPAYPAYVDTSVISGLADEYDEKTGRYGGMTYLPCVEENGFFPSVPDGKVDLIYLCNPNNPTGAAATAEQLREFVGYAKKNGAVIIFDAAYSEFITDPAIPKSIYQVEGAHECAIEINSFSKSAGFTGVRLGWSVVPSALRCEDAPAGKINELWKRRQCTYFNGASNIAQAGGIAALTERGRAECAATAGYYMENARIIREGLREAGLTAYGGTNAPFLWVKTPDGAGSWEFFDELLQKARVVTTPGAGFGPHGEGFVRVSAFGHKKDIIEAVESVKKNIGKGAKRK